MGKSSQGDLINEARQINSSLRRAGQQVRVGVLQTESVSATLQQDGETIARSLHEHKYELKSALKSTSKKLSSIKNAAVLERYYLLGSLTLFGAVVTYIILKRTGLLAIAAFYTFNYCKV